MIGSRLEPSQSHSFTIHPHIQDILIACIECVDSASYQNNSFHYSEVLETLSEIAESSKPEAANQASSLFQSLKQLETALMCQVWNDILTKINFVSKAPQEPGIEICTVVKLLNSLVNHLEKHS